MNDAKTCKQPCVSYHYPLSKCSIHYDLVYYNKYRRVFIYLSRTTLSQDKQTRSSVQLAFAKFLSKIKENIWGSAVSMILAL